MKDEKSRADFERKLNPSRLSSSVQTPSPFIARGEPPHLEDGALRPHEAAQLILPQPKRIHNNIPKNPISLKFQTPPVSSSLDGGDAISHGASKNPNYDIHQAPPTLPTKPYSSESSAPKPSTIFTQNPINPNSLQAPCTISIVDGGVHGGNINHNSLNAQSHAPPLVSCKPIITKSATSIIAITENPLVTITSTIPSSLKPSYVQATIGTTCLQLWWGMIALIQKTYVQLPYTKENQVLSSRCPTNNVT
ncbi:hypothetical protein LIER_25994 [Lithospermum erythrorhizon]|uniref:Uncharacterized protein n=1 Tax=Lithospermum erythrorhizon TaxID=34254 RepID=A0AAV3R6U1_LITER